MPAMPAEKYIGERTPRGCEVWGVNTNGSKYPLPLQLGLRNHSPTGFEWGYGGSGPSQLALALLVDALDDIGDALLRYQQFKWKVVAGLPLPGWTLSREQVLNALMDTEER